jgi:Domain of Unknown Function (DUF928)
MNSLYFLLRASAQRLAVVLTVMGLVFDGAIEPLQAQPLAQPISQVRGSKQAQPDANQIMTASEAHRWSFGFGDTGQPGDRGGGASRSFCSLQPSQADSKPVSLTALMPETNLALTLSERPTFWFYIPYTNVHRATFDLFDDRDNLVIEAPVTIEFSNRSGESSPIPGIISVTLPDTAPPLELDREYHWYFQLEYDKLECYAESPSKNLPLHGWVKRVSLDSQPDSPTKEGTISGLVTPDELAQLLAQLDQAQTPRERFFAYATHHIWSDALTEIARDRQGFPIANPLWSDRDRDWSDLLRSVNCETLSDTDVYCSKSKTPSATDNQQSTTDNR